MQSSSFIFQGQKFNEKWSIHLRGLCWHFTVIEIHDQHIESTNSFGRVSPMDQWVHCREVHVRCGESITYSRISNTIGCAYISKQSVIYWNMTWSCKSQYFDILNLKLVLETFNGFLSYFLFPCMRVRKYEFLIPKTLYNFHFKYRYSHLKIRQFIAFK